jgi:hypothetical protein
MELRFATHRHPGVSPVGEKLSRFKAVTHTTHSVIPRLVIPRLVRGTCRRTVRLQVARTS